VAATDGLPTLLYGAGRTGVMLARSAQRNPGAGVRPVGFLDDDPSLREEFVGGIRVFGGLTALPDAVARTGARVLLITMPGAPGSIIRQVVDAALMLQLEVRTVPSLTHLLDGTMDAYRVAASASRTSFAARWSASTRAAWTTSSAAGRS
jgi:FlaA1/EpsC-like NDP-sugar epimerase